MVDIIDVLLLTQQMVVFSLIAQVMCMGGGFEILGRTTDDRGLSFSDAKNYWNWSSADLPRGQEPQLGAILCQSYNPAGHVAVVEEIIDENTIRTSESNYGQERFVVRIRRRQWNWDWIPNGGAVFQGFIYLPDSPVPPTPPTDNNFKWWMARKILLNRKRGL